MTRQQREMRWGEVVSVVVILGGLLFVAVAVLSPACVLRSREPARRASCQNNLKQLGLIFKMYSNENPNERLPTVQAGYFEGVDGPILDLGPRVPQLYPEFMDDPNVLRCPSDEGSTSGQFHNESDALCFDIFTADAGRCARAVDNSYVYFGYWLDAVSTESPMGAVADLKVLAPVPIDASGLAQDAPVPVQAVKTLEALAPKLRKAVDQRDETAFFDVVDSDITGLDGQGNSQGDTLYRLREGLEYAITAPEAVTQPERQRVLSTIFVMLDRRFLADTGNHVPGGANVLYLDGHVNFIRLGAAPPATEPMAHLIQALTQSSE